MIENREQYLLLVEDKVWTSDNGRNVPLETMADRHLQNITAKLRRQQEQVTLGVRKSPINWVEANSMEVDAVINTVMNEVARRGIDEQIAQSTRPD